MKKFLILALVFGSVFGLLNCGGWHKSPEKRAEWVVKKISSELDLNDSQKKELERMKGEYLAKRKELKMEISETDITDFQAIVKKDKLDDAKFDKMIDEKFSKRNEMRKFLQKKFSEFHAILDAKQKEKLSEKLGKMMRKHHHEIH